MDAEIFGGSWKSLVIAIGWMVVVAAFGGIFLRALSELRDEVQDKAVEATAQETSARDH